MKIAIIGCGTVGSQVADLATEYGHTVTALADSKSAITNTDGINVTEVLDSKRRGEEIGTGTPESALDGTYDVLVEATPTTLGDAQPGFSHVRTALERDRHAVSANPGPIAERYADIRTLERNSAGKVLFGATVGGALPIISTITDFGPERISSVRGVLNGTANFVLSRMAAEGLDYEHVLAEVQNIGVAKADPSFDMGGTDVGIKCIVLANVLAQDGSEYTLSDASIEGITDVSGSALDLASEDGQTIRLIGEVEERVRVGPRLVPKNAPLAVSGMTNSVQLETEYAGQVSFSGRGAGGSEAAMAVFADIDRLD